MNMAWDSRREGVERRDWERSDQQKQRLISAGGLGARTRPFRFRRLVEFNLTLSRLGSLQTLERTLKPMAAARGGITSNSDLLSVNFNQDSTFVSPPPLRAQPLTIPAPAGASLRGRGRDTPSPTAIRLERSTARVSLALSGGLSGGSCELVRRSLGEEVAPEGRVGVGGN